MTEQHSDMDVCPTCGTTRITFDPPLVFDEAEACGQMRPGNWAAGYVPTCDMPAGHEGGHGHLVERLDQWADPDGWVRVSR